MEICRGLAAPHFDRYAAGKRLFIGLELQRGYVHQSQASLDENYGFMPNAWL